MRAFPALLCCALLAASADARADGRTVAVGLETSLNGLYITERGIRATYEHPLARGLHIGLGGVYLPRRDGPDLKWLSHDLQGSLDLNADISRQRWRGDLSLHWSPFAITTARHEGHLALHTGYGLARTDDDLELLRQEGQSYAEATEHQIIPTMRWGLFADLGGPRLRARVGLERVARVETFSSTTLEMRKLLVLSVSLVLRSPFPPPDPDERTDQTYEGDGPAR
jgi:hypothetical protein